MFASDENTKEMLEAILQSIDEGIHVINRDGITIYYNEIAADHDGLEKKDVIGKPLLEVFPSLSSSTSTMLKVVKTGKPIYNQPQTYRNIKGKLIDTINSTIPVIVNQEVLGAVEIAKDYSRIKELSKKLIDLQSEMNERKTKPQVVEQKQPHYTFSNILSSNEKMMSIIEKAKLAAKTTSPILVYGETGTGKELFVQSIHNASKRSLGPLISQNCAAIPPSLLESILFGTTKGSFTGAENKEGLFELAHGGTLFLDEIHTLPFDLQAKLLRILEDGIIRRVGSTTTIQTNVRIITATNEPPQKLIHDETLRKDLYYRLNVVSISIPPLRERIEDLPELISFFINKYNSEFKKNIQHFSEDTMKILMNYDWPGNVRELQHCIESIMNLTDEKMITRNLLPDYLFEMKPRTLPLSTGNMDSLKDQLAHIEKELIKRALIDTNHNVNKAAKRLKLPRQTLQYKISKYKLD